MKKEQKRYTAQEFREAGDWLVLSSHAIKDGKIRYDYDNLKSTLRYAADVLERCEKAVESMHTQLMHLANEGKTTVDIGRLSEYFAHFENILRGDAENEGK